MEHFIRDYDRFIKQITWTRRTDWLAVNDSPDPEPLASGPNVQFSGTAGDVWISGPVPMPLDHDTLSVTIKGMVKNCRVGIEWCQAKKGKFHPVIWGANDGKTFKLENIPAIPTTASFRVVVEAQTDGEVSLTISSCVGSLRPKLDVLVNQVGYDIGSPKRFTVQSNGPLEGDAHFRVIAPIAGPGREFETVFEGKLESAGDVPEWGRWYWRGDFSSLDTPGNYFIDATIGDLNAESPLFSIGHDFIASKTLDSAQRFFFWQRCGQAVPGWHEACHLDDRVTTESGVTIEAAGAWHDAGDYNKYNGYTPLSLYSLLYARETCPHLFQTWRNTGRDDILDEALWGAEYLRKMQDPATGELWDRHFSGYGYWGLPENETDNRIGGDEDRVAKGKTLNLWFVAAFAHLGQLLDNEEYIGRALAHWKLAYKPDSPDLAHAAQTIFAARELDLATGDPTFEKIALEAAKKIVACQSHDDTLDGWYAGSPGGKPAYGVVDDGLPAAALGRWTEWYPEDAFVESARESLKRYVGYVQAISHNPLGIAKVHTQKHDAWFFPFAKDGDWHVGQNSQYLSDAWAALVAHRVTGESRALEVALDQINWVLGCNPYGICMMQGHGRVNSPTAHHRYNMIVGQPQGAVPGSVFNGIVRFNAANDIPLWDLIPHGTPRYECNEPWLPHNAYYLFAVSELARIV